MDKQLPDTPRGKGGTIYRNIQSNTDQQNQAIANIDPTGFDRSADLYNIGKRSANGFNATSPVPTATLTSSRKPEVPPMPMTATAQNNLGVTASNVMSAPIPTPQQTQSASLLDTLKKSIGMQSTQGTETLKAQKEQDVAGKIKAVTDITNEAITVGKSYDDKLKELEKNPQGLYGGGLSDAMDSLRRKKNEELANIGIRQQVAQNNLEGAQKIVDDKIKAKFEPIDNQIKSLTQLYSLYQNDMTESEKFQAQTAIEEKKNARNTLETAQRDAYKAAVENGAPQSVLTAIGEATDSLGVYGALGPYAVNLDEQAYKRAQTAQIRANTKKVLADLGGGVQENALLNNPTTSAYFDAFANASVGLSNFSDKEKSAEMNRLTSNLANGRVEQAKEQVIRLAFAGKTGTQKESAIQRLQAIDSLKTISTLLNEAVEKSGDTGLVSGSIQTALNKLGTSGNTDLVKIQTRITQALQVYRNAITGAAWGEQETAEYKQLFPSYNNTNDLNQTIIQGMTEALDANQRISLGAYIGQDTYDKIFKPGQIVTAPGGEQIEITD